MRSDASEASDRSSALTPPLATSRGLGNDELRTQGLPQVVEQENDEIPAVPSERSPRAERIREHPRNGCSKPRVRSCCSRHCAGQDAGVPVGRVHSERSVEARSPVIPSAAPQARRRGIAVVPGEGLGSPFLVPRSAPQYLSDHDQNQNDRDEAEADRRDAPPDAGLGGHADTDAE